MKCLEFCTKKFKKNTTTNSSITSKNGIEIEVIIYFVKVIYTQQVNIASIRRRSKLGKDNDRNITSQITTKKYAFKPLYQLKDRFRCLFCGGDGCKHENWTRNKNSVINGLNCDEITEDLFASQRPSTVLISQFNLIKRFKELNIGLIVNVQRQGEHPYCGPNKGLEEISGFTYNPEDFTTEGIRVRLSGWKDMNVPDSIPFMLEIVKDMQKTVKGENRKILVHCHAGYGRTGIVLACYIIFTTTKSAELIVKEIREIRRECIQKKHQMQYCQTFKDYIDRAREIFTSSKKPVDYFIKYQVEISYGDESDNFQHVPKIIFLVLEEILVIKTKMKINNVLIYKCINGTSDWKDEYEKEIVELKIQMNYGHWSFVKEVDEINILVEICFDWLDDCVLHVINPDRVFKLFEDQRELLMKIKEHISHPREFTKEERKTINQFIKNEFKMIEYETIICVADFANKIYPDANDDGAIKDEYNLMLEKLAIYLLGYNIDIVYENSNLEQTKQIFFIVERLIDLIVFLVMLIKFDFQEEVAIKMQVKTKTSIANLNTLSHYLVRKQLAEINNSAYNTFMNKQNISSNDDDMANNGKIILAEESFSKNNIESEINTNNKVLREDKDKILFDMYETLHQYFDKKNNLEVIAKDEFILNNNYLKESNNDNGTETSFTNNISSQNLNVEDLNEFYESLNKLMNKSKNNTQQSTPRNRIKKNESDSRKSTKKFNCLNYDAIVEENTNNFDEASFEIEIRKNKDFAKSEIASGNYNTLKSNYDPNKSNHQENYKTENTFGNYPNSSGLQLVDENIVSSNKNIKYKIETPEDCKCDSEIKINQAQFFSVKKHGFIQKENSCVLNKNINTDEIKLDQNNFKKLNKASTYKFEDKVFNGNENAHDYSYITPKSRKRNKIGKSRPSSSYDTNKIRIEFGSHQSQGITK